MATRRDRWITALLCSICLTVALAELVPRLTVRHAPIAFVSPDISVAIEGAVRVPGAFDLPFGATVQDLVSAAGGFTDGAARSLVNLADPLTAGEVVIVPKSVADDGDERIDVNSASVDRLVELPGIGPVTAAAIVAGRPYASIDDLLSVRGIGPKTLERLRPWIGL